MAGRIALELVHSLLPGRPAGPRAASTGSSPLEGEFDLDRRLDALRRMVRRNRARPDHPGAGRRGRAARHPGDAARREEPDPARPRPPPAEAPRLDHRPHLAGRRRPCRQQGHDQEAARRERRSGAARRSSSATSRRRCAAAKRLRYPLVTKPLDGNHGRGVTIGIMNEEQLRFGFGEAAGPGQGPRRHRRAVLRGQRPPHPRRRRQDGRGRRAHPRPGGRATGSAPSPADRRGEPRSAPRRGP